MNSLIIGIIIILLIVLIYWFNRKENFNGYNDPNTYNDPAYAFRLNRNFEYSKKLDYNNPNKPLFQYNNQAYNIESFSAGAEKGDGSNPSNNNENPASENSQKPAKPAAPPAPPTPPKPTPPKWTTSDKIKRTELKANEAGIAALTSRGNTFGMVKDALNGTETPEAAAVRKNWANPLDPIGPVELEDPDITYYQFEGPPFNPAYVFNEPTKQSKIYPEAYYKPQGLNNIGQLSRAYYKSRVYPEYPNVKYMYENSWDPKESYMNHSRYSVPAVKNSYGRTSITGVEKF